MSKQTAVEWLVEKLDQNFDYVADTLIEQATEMEKEQIVEAINYGCSDWGSFKDGREYYKETFKKI